MRAQRILVAGIGNVFFGDDGFGVAVAQQLARRSLPAQVTVMDAGIRGIDLTYALLEGYDAAILIDTVARGGAPGTLYVLDPDEGATGREEPASLLDAHGLDPVRVLAFVRASGAPLRCLRVVGCEPESLGSDEAPQVGLTVAVERAVGTAVELVEELVAGVLASGTQASAEVLDA
jgi:hydrogenase maturation protease